MIIDWLCTQNIEIISYETFFSYFLIQFFVSITFDFKKKKYEILFCAFCLERNFAF